MMKLICIYVRSYIWYLDNLHKYIIFNKNNNIFKKEKDLKNQMYHGQPELTFHFLITV